jgi:hypothetical protein
MAVLLLPVCTFGQSDKKIPSFGKVDNADLVLSSCEFDPNAEAMVLVDYGQFYLDFRGEYIYQELRRHVRIKILSDKGKEHANVKLRYHSFRNDEDIVDLVANTYNVDANGNIQTTKLDKKLVYTKKLNAKYSEQSFTLPDVQVGSIVEYKYSVRNGGDRYWNLQKSIPVRYSKYEINFPSAVDVLIRPLCSLPYETKDNSTTLRTIKSFAMANIPAFHDEKYITCKDDYLQKIEAYVIAFTYQGRRYPFMKSWPKIAEELNDDEDFGRQLNKEIPRTAELDAELKVLKNDYLKMVAIHNYVRRNMTWDGINNIWAQNGVKSAWKDKSGTSGEINLILVNLLKDAGLQAYPMMVSTRDNGMLATTFPTFESFNKVMAYVELNDKRYVLDGTDKYTPACLMPEDIMCTEGFVLDPNQMYKFRWVQVWDSAKMDKNTVVVQAWLNSEGKMQGKTSIRSYDYARIKRAPYIKQDKNDFLSRFYIPDNSGIAIDSLEFRNENIDTLPLEQAFKFSTTVSQSGEYSYFSTSLFSGLKSNPFIADNRFSDVFFGTNQTFNLVGNFSIPDGYQFDELPKNIRFSLPDKSLVVTRMMAASGNVLNTRITIEFKRPFYTPEEYADLKEFYKKMYSLLDEQIVIKKSNS